MLQPCYSRSPRICSQFAAALPSSYNFRPILRSCLHTQGTNLLRLRRRLCLRVRRCCPNRSFLHRRRPVPRGLDLRRGWQVPPAARATIEDREAACRLRFRVFNIEMGEGLASSYRDRPRYRSIRSVLRTSRRRRKADPSHRRHLPHAVRRNRRANLGYYSEQEFHFAPYEPLRRGHPRAGPGLHRPRASHSRGAHAALARHCAVCYATWGCAISSAAPRSTRRIPAKAGRSIARLRALRRLA